MCLTQKFWEEANKEAIKYEKRGYKFLAGIMFLKIKNIYTR
jgi:hypothetical protein